MPKTRIIVYTALIAALYTVFTVALAPLSYGPLQFRVSEVLKGLVIWQPLAIPGIVLGTVLANLTSPYVGVWELIWMPFTDGLGGLLAWWIGRRWPWGGAVCYALTTGAAVALMLSLVLAAPFWPLFVSVTVSEAIIIVGGLPIMRYITTNWRWKDAR